MSVSTAVGGLLVAGFVVFLVGAAAWRPAFEGEPAGTLPEIGARPTRWTWIHTWLIAGTIVTTAGLWGLVALLGGPGQVAASTAAVVFGLGAAAWIVALAFRLAVTPWAAAEPDLGGRAYVAADRWAVRLYEIHMVASYVSFAVVGVAVRWTPGLPGWVGWLGVGLGVVMTTGLVATGFAGPFNPPIMAHVYPAVVGVVLLAS